MDKEEKITQPNWYNDANFLSKVFFCWMIPMFNKGFVRTLGFEDLCRCVRYDEPKRCTQILEREWNKELKRRDKNKKYVPSIAKSIIRGFWFKFVLNSQITFWGDMVIRLSQPFMIGVLVRYLSQSDLLYYQDQLHFSNNSQSNITYVNENNMINGLEPVSQTKAVYFAILLVVTSIIYSFSRHPGWVLNIRVTINVKTALTVMLYRKILKLSKSSLGKTDIGQILNILANDLNRFEDLGWQLPFFFIGPIMAVVVIYISYMYLGISCVGGLVILLLFVPFQGLMGRLFSSFRQKTTKLTDSRVRVMGEVITAMKLIKLYCWEAHFAEKVAEIREREVFAIRRSAYLTGVNTAMFFVATRVMLFASFITHVLLGNPLDAETVFVMMALFNSIQIPVTAAVPQAIGTGAEALVTCDRIAKILLLEERQDRSESIELPKGTISFNQFSGKWTEALEQDNLKKIILEVEPGQLVVVIGTVGAGKTCLLHAVLNEISTTSGGIKLSGSTSYAPQESWCFSGTIRGNILLGAKYDEDRYNAVVKACSLERDMTLFPNGDQTFVGEKGYSLSGGQKARVTLARAVYNQADVYLLDDPLSAVDPRVSNHIFDRCIKEYLKNKTVILVTHQLQFLTKADKIVVLKEGEAIAIGNYDQLLNSGIDFLAFLEKKEEKEEKKESFSKQKSMSIHKEDGEDMVNGGHQILAQTNSNHKMSLSGSIGKSFRSRTRISSLSRSISYPTDEEDGKEIGHGMTQEEEALVGSIKARVYWDYLRSGASVVFIFLVLGVALASEGLFHFTDLWLANWTNQFRNGSNHEDQTNNTITYTVLISVLFVSAFLRATAVFYLCLRCSVSLHDMVFKRVLRAPMLFFENNPLGRILNRLTRDVGIVDQHIPHLASELEQTLINVLGVIVVSIIVEPYLAIPCFCLGILAVPVRLYYVRSARALERLDSLARSPVYTHVSATFDGLTTVRAFGLQDLFDDQFIKFMNDSVACRWLVMCSGCIMGFILDGFSNLYIAAICIALVATPPGTIPAGQGGLILSSSLALVAMFLYGVWLTAQFETEMVSAERVLEYAQLEQEAVLRIESRPLGVGWPEKGHVTFDNVTLRYSRDLPAVLKNISFRINPAERIGIVGRTGAGKSSLISVLFRLVEPDGTITIDGIDTKSLGLHELREKISIIPQDPTLFSGTIRKNLDPFGVYPDDKLWDALKSANLDGTVNTMPEKLDSIMTEGGGNLSVGQRQLLCLSRALLKNNRILVLDEATANVDHETDEIIQTTMKNGFTDCTILTVAHRLNTIIDMDRILVMEAGQVIEFDVPHLLLQNPNGHFHSMVAQTGKEFESMLHKMAEIAYKESRKTRSN